VNEAPLLDVRALSAAYLTREGRVVPALADVGFQLRKGEVLGVVGESGCGKSTLLRSLLRLLPANCRITAGHITFQGRELRDASEKALRTVRGRQIGMIFQSAQNGLNPVQPVGRQIGEVLRRHGLVRGRTAVADRVAALLQRVGIHPRRAADYPHQFSGGMRQRVMIAIALAGNPQMLIADEPTTALDVIVQAGILDLLRALQAQLGLAILLVTHDLGVVAELCDTVLVMFGGTAVEYAPAARLFDHPQHPYTRQLLQAIPDLRAPAAAQTAVPVDFPHPIPLLSGCCFVGRCPIAEARCRREAPARRLIAPDHWVRCHLVEQADG
jgi:peptide/nickel transport system ATP-binding protein